MNTVPRPGRAYWICQVAGWGAYGLLGIAMSQAFGYGSPRMHVTTLAGTALGGLLTHLWRGVILGRGLLALPFGSLLPRLVGGVVVVALGCELAVWATGLALGVYTIQGSTPGIMLATSANWMFVVTLWTAIYVSAHWFARWRDSEIQRLRLTVLARDAELAALHAQIQPHFLFNAMNVLRAMIAEDPARARDLVTELSELMRYALQAGRRERVTIDEELAVVESYLQIESARFMERLTWKVEAGEDVRRLALPPMLVQTLVENAVKHGIAASMEGGTVSVAAAREDGMVRVRVTNPGRLRTAGDTQIGLANARERLRLLYGERAALTLVESGGEVVAEVTLPAEERA